ncbi:MAG: hypothetical protein PHS54_03885 [Clostridia bacterium]|nr:hypothetical protein [Clostridia bacterium]
MKTNYDGYLEYNNLKYIFVFSDNILTIFPDTDLQIDPLSNFFNSFNYKPESNQFIKGKTNCNREIIFLKVNFHLKNNGVLYSYVPGFIISKNNIYENKIEKISAMRFDGEIINKFYNPQIIIKKNDVNFFSTGQKSVVLRDINEITKIFDLKHYKILVSVSIESPTKTSLGTINSFITMEFPKELDIEEIIEYYSQMKKLFEFLTFRKSIDFEKISLYKKNVDDSLECIAYLVVANNKKRENNSFKNIILYSELEEKFPEVMQNIMYKNYYNFHFPENNDESNYVDSGSFLATASGFENNFSKAFPDFLSKKDENYGFVKNEIVSFLNELDEKNKGKNAKVRKYCSRFINSIELMDGNLEEKLLFAFNEFSEIMKDVKLRILKNNEVYGKSDNDIIGKYVQKRNKFSHGNIDDYFFKEDIACHLIVNAIIYVFALKKSNLSDDKIKIIINKMFN